ncbi:AarF/UbiB family protein [Vibrio ziniensis]|uniref:Phosphotransferase n=1 Tax=Vibrio ziniensis TaxID=2711221 RepID=A0A6G7CNB0_9VIBR|nr:AarF/UbiB family protein [Vibrio ziniensis]QIH43585.1 phosphotransferase [Vibrio ziniensis]
MNLRQQQQKEFDESSENIIIGDEPLCPLQPSVLAAITEDSPFVLKVIRSGLTAEIYHLRIDGKEYNLKKRRQVAKVANLDGQYSFLNEVQRRNDLQKLKQKPETAQRLAHIVPTIYANYRLGIILSPWIEGEHISEITSDLMEQLFNTLLACEEYGLMEWDLCSGNLLVDEEQQLWLFDFGYMYSFDPKSEFNSNGITDPLFHMVERFETRFFFGWLLKREQPLVEQLALYRTLKQRAVVCYQQKVEWLKAHQAKVMVINHYQSIISAWQTALVNDEALWHLFLLELFRSHVLDIDDDIDGQSCTSLTLKRISIVLDILENNFDYLLLNDGLFYSNKGKSQQELIQRYKEKRLLAQKYQL